MEVSGQRLDNVSVSKLCEPCQEGNVTAQADGYCNDCEEYMCQTCFQSHVKMKLGKHHVLGTIHEGIRTVSQKSETKCKKHTGEVIKYYCRNHDSVACGHCLVFDHRKCEPELIEDLVKNLEESPDFKNIFKEVDDLESLKTEFEVSLEQNRNDNTELHDKAIQGIQKHRSEMNTWLDIVTSKMEAEEMEIWKENETALSKLEDWIKIINDMIDKVRDEINIEKFTGENLFIRMIECKSEVNEFVKENVPEIKSNLDIKSYEFEPNQTLCVFTKSANLGIIRLCNKLTELQIDQQERQSEVTYIEGASNVASYNLPEHEAEVVWAGDTCKSPEDPVRVELEKELEQLRNTTSVETKEQEVLQQFYDRLKQELVDKESLLSRERDKYVLEIKEHDQRIVLLKQEVSTLNDLNTSLRSQLDIRNKEFEVLESTYKARQEQDNNQIKYLQSELNKIRESHEEECRSLSSQIRDLRQKVSSKPTYKLPDPRAAGFDFGTRVESIACPGYRGTVTGVVSSGYVNVRWDHDRSYQHNFKAGAGGEYVVKL